MKITVLGSGTFFVDKDISASSFVLDTGEKKCLIDCGPGTLLKLSQAGFSFKDLDYIFISHFHPDHTSDLFPLFMNYRLSDTFSPGTLTKYPTFYGPEGLSKFMLDYSNLVELHSVEGYDNVKFVDYTSEMKIGDFTLKTFKVEHKAFNLDTRAYALRFEIDGKVIAFSGDSAKCEGVQNACKDVDVFVCDTSYPSDQKVNNVHMNTTEIAEISKNGNVKKLVLDHFYPSFMRYDLVKEVRAGFEGEIVKAKDFDIIEV